MTYHLICLDLPGGYKWIMQKHYANLQVTEDREGGKVCNIGGFITAPDNGCYWQSLDEYLTIFSPDDLKIQHLTGAGTSAIIRALSPTNDLYDNTIVNYLRGYHELHLGDYIGINGMEYAPIKTNYTTTIKEMV